MQQAAAPGAGFERPSLKRWIVRGVAAILSQDQNSCGLRSEGWRGGGGEGATIDRQSSIVSECVGEAPWPAEQIT